MMQTRSTTAKIRKHCLKMREMKKMRADLKKENQRKQKERRKAKARKIII